MEILLIVAQIVSALFIYFGILAIADELFKSEQWPPNFLNFKPFSCEVCFTFWSQLFAFGCFWLISRWDVTLVIGVLLTILTGIAKHVEEKNNTISIDEYNDRRD